MIYYLHRYPSQKLVYWLSSYLAKNCQLINPLMLKAAKYSLTIVYEINRGKSKVKKIFEGEMFMRTLIIILLQIFSKITLYFKLIVKSILGPDDNFWRNS